MRDRIAVITFPTLESGNIPLSNLIGILRSSSNDIHLVTGNAAYYFFKDDKRVNLHTIMHESGSGIFTRIFRHVRTQLKLSREVVVLHREIGTWIFFFGGEYLLLPMLTVKLLGGKIIILLPGSITDIYRCSNDIYSKIFTILMRINLYLSDRILVYSPAFAEGMDLRKYDGKVAIAHEHFVDFGHFCVRDDFHSRGDLVGYIGRLSVEKGVMNFVLSIPKILKEMPDEKFLIGGDGPLREKIERYIIENSLSSRVILTGWISHDRLPEYLNQLKLIIIPSYTEGLPNIMLEAMACGTPVLASKVGAIPDIIIDGKTGFLMENNSPICITRNVVRALKWQEIEKITDRSLDFIKKEFTFERAVYKWRQILENF